ncbi:MAG: cytochrome c [Hyphomonadaceae bacterium]|nr:cytochrome c [Hyphomonadaceae bacterium]
MRTVALTLALSLAACTATTTAPESPASGSEGDAARGLAFAEATCGSCHRVAAGLEMSPYPAAPPFEEIANTPGMTRLALGVWMQSSHPSMPQLVVEPEQLDDVHAYLLTLKRGG